MDTRPILELLNFYLKFYLHIRFKSKEIFFVLSPAHRGFLLEVILLFFSVESFHVDPIGEN